jgi:glycerol-3-phosphate dehydrogenase (NAD(P)+)
MKTVVIIGAGVMGSAMALPFSDRGFAVKLVGTHLDADIVNSIKGRNFHPSLNVNMPPNVQGFFHHELTAELSKDCDLILLGVSSLGVSWAIEQLLHCMVRPTPILMITKGMHAEHNSLVALPDLVFKSLAEKFGKNLQVAAIAGPCIAGELAVRRSTGTTIVARDKFVADQLCSELETDYYHPRASADMIGVEVCAAYKNFFAIAVGWAQGNLEKISPAENKAKNNNAAAIIFDQAVRELMHLTTALGGQAESVWGMPGVGDLYVTCQAGRNSRLGNHLGRGLTYDQVRTGPMQGDTIEGADLGRATGACLKSMMAQDILNEASMPLTKSLLTALMDQKPLDIQWHKFHRTF